MRFISLFIVLFAAIVTGCPPPFNNFKFLTNDTTATIQEYLSANPNLGWSEAVSKVGNAHTRWPTNNDGYTVIRYCYDSAYDKVMAKDLLEGGWDLWSSQLGPAGQQSGHRLKLQEVSYKQGPGTNPYCSNKDETPEDALHVHFGTDGSIQDDGASYATLGYISKDWDPSVDRHAIKIGEGAAFGSLAHELGHVLGLMHEHQRPDRDHYVKFACQNLDKYENFRRAVVAVGADKIEDVCKSSTLGYKYGWSAAAAYSTEIYITEGKDGKKAPLTDQTYGPYDYSSIMHYKSTDFSGGKDFNAGIGAMPLVRWAKGAPDYQPPSGTPKFPEAVFLVAPKDYKPSAGDLDGVKKLYPWGHN